MALKKDWPIGAHLGLTQTLPDCYIKVVRVEGNKHVAFASFEVQHDGRPLTTEVREFSVDLNGSNFIAEAYKHLKTLPEFSGAIDC
jgi:hypothetical protein